MSLKYLKQVCVCLILCFTLTTNLNAGLDEDIEEQRLKGTSSGMVAVVVQQPPMAIDPDDFCLWYMGLRQEIAPTVKKVMMGVLTMSVTYTACNFFYNLYQISSIVNATAKQ